MSQAHVPPPSAQERHTLQKQFQQQYAAETGRPPSNPAHFPSTEELTFAARVAWRNAGRCIGRSYWQALEVRDLRHICDPDAVFAELQRHLARAWNGGRIRSVMSVFSPKVRILNDQLIRYAGYQSGPNEASAGAVLGDPQNAALTQRLMQLGWQPPATRTAFDVLPLAIATPQGVTLREWAAEDVREVAIFHPELGDLGLKWHALPVISNMELRFGGLSYPCAPFNGWYMGTEISARNLADVGRYNALPMLARRLGLDTRRERTLWRDRALVELSRAVLHSFDVAGVRIDDHHALGQQFVQFEAREQAAGRRVNGQWDWLIPPLSPATSPVWPRSYAEDRALTPGLFHRQEATRCPVAPK